MPRHKMRRKNAEENSHTAIMKINEAGCALRDFFQMYVKIIKRVPSIDTLASEI